MKLKFFFFLLAFLLGVVWVVRAVAEAMAQLDEEMARPEVATSSFKLMELSKEQDKVTARLEELYELWETLAEE